GLAHRRRLRRQPGLALAARARGISARSFRGFAVATRRLVALYREPRRKAVLLRIPGGTRRSRPARALEYLAGNRPRLQLRRQPRRAATARPRAHRLARSRADRARRGG